MQSNFLHKGQGYNGIDCMRYTNGNYLHYGNKNVSVSGRPCVPWQRVEDEMLAFATLVDLPTETWSEVGNKCR